jgi:hypothetical protein
LDGIFCNNCGAKLDEAPTLLPDQRPPCPRCGSVARRFEQTITGSVTIARAQPATLAVTAHDATVSVQAHAGVAEGVGHRGSWNCRSSWSGRCLAVCATARSSTVEVAAAPPPVRLGPELAFQLHQTLDPGAVGAEVGLDVRGPLQMVARSTPSSSAHRSSGAAIGQPRSGSCQVPARAGYRTPVRDPIGNATGRNRRTAGAHWGHRAPVCTGQQRTIQVRK